MSTATVSFICSYFMELTLDNADQFLAVACVVLLDGFFGVIAGIKREGFKTFKALSVLRTLGTWWIILGAILHHVSNLSDIIIELSDEDKKDKLKLEHYNKTINNLIYSESDHITLLIIVNNYLNSTDPFAFTKNNYLNNKQLLEIKETHIKLRELITKQDSKTKKICGRLVQPKFLCNWNMFWQRQRTRYFRKTNPANFPRYKIHHKKRELAMTSSHE